MGNSFAEGARLVPLHTGFDGLNDRLLSLSLVVNSQIGTAASNPKTDSRPA
jgi:hypothetical protein